MVYLYKLVEQGMVAVTVDVHYQYVVIRAYPDREANTSCCYGLLVHMVQG